MNRKSSNATEKDPLFVEEHNIALSRSYFINKKIYTKVQNSVNRQQSVAHHLLCRNYIAIGRSNVSHKAV
jgi:hypothetical protein